MGQVLSEKEKAMALLLVIVCYLFEDARQED